MNSLPRVSGTAAPSPAEIFWQQTEKTLEQLFGRSLFADLVAAFQWLAEYWWVGALLIVFVSGIWFLRRQAQIAKHPAEESWRWILFFLVKRVMVLPVLITKLRQQGLPSEPTFEKIIALRHAERTEWRKLNRTERFEKEVQLSEVLYGLLHNLSQKQIAQDDPVIAKLLSDLEFFDQKLIDLQAQYNQSVRRWHDTWWQNWRWVLWPLRVRRPVLFGPQA